ncbi:O-acetyl-ADP-ribose deacetylase [Arthrobacter sp. H14-L1]|uniref:O-acetyl-ADP-ribose deacetylase n=1 Tax=Arthrobacter sp. H14-L1 TaxID=2996697 RepID=UPI00226F46A4|nr:O-acetyl-ADP-ribose deacetylase [Arthrobacter sp. H14-L1]MCY0905589.1 O-acetyl-ADP-ribose deacetylase [Arthrobacter sp. H14-L1]
MDISIVEGDITLRRVDAIVNAANSSLLGGGGVDGAIHRAAGPRLLAACRELRRTVLPDGLPVGAAVTTEAFDLPARWVIHTVGPNRHAGQRDPALLSSCFTASLQEAARLGARSVAFPAIGAGVYGWPAAQVAQVAFDGIGRYQHAQRAGDSSAGAAAPGETALIRAALSEPELIEFVLFTGDIASVFRETYAAGNALS